MAIIIQQSDTEVIVQVAIKLNGSMMDIENAIQAGVNEVGNVATEAALSKFDATGKPINIAGIQLTSKGKVAKEYQTPYGAIMLNRHVYQTSKGGKTFCPLDDKARIIVSSTPKFAQMIAYKYAGTSAIEVASTAIH